MEVTLLIIVIVVSWYIGKIVLNSFGGCLMIAIVLLLMLVSGLTGFTLPDLF